MGIGFGSIKDNISVTLPNGDSLCTISYVGYGMFLCVTNQQDPETVPGNTELAVRISVNGIEDNQYTVTFRAASFAATSISPMSYSPILK